MTDQERIEMAFDILDNCLEYARSGDTVLVAIDRELWEKFKQEDDDE